MVAMAVARAGERAGAFHDLVEHGIEVEARADAQARRAQRGDSRAQRLDLALKPVLIRHRLSSAYDPESFQPIPVKVTRRSLS